MNKLNKENIFQNFDDIVSVKELCKMLNIGKTFAYKLIGNGEIEHIKSGNRIFVPKQCVIDFLNGGANER